MESVLNGEALWSLRSVVDQPALIADGKVGQIGISGRSRLGLATQDCDHVNLHSDHPMTILRRAVDP